MFKNHKEKKYLNGVLKYVQEQIWNGKYAREKLRAIREHIRQNYDFHSEQLRGVNDGLAKEGLPEEAKLSFEKKQEELQKQVEGLKQNLAEWDGKIEAKENEIKGLRSELEMLTQYIKQV